MTEMDGELDRAVDQYDNDLELVTGVIEDMEPDSPGAIAEADLEKLNEAGRLKA